MLQCLIRIFALLLLPIALIAETNSVFIGVVVKNYDQLVPFFLKSIDNLDYDKKLVDIQFDICSGSPETQKTLLEWALKNQSAYKNIVCNNQSQNFLLNQGLTERNKFFGEIKDSYLAKAQKLHCDYCFILSSDVFLLPTTLKHLMAKDKPIIAPLLRPIPEAKDPFRNFFAATTGNGYYKHHDDYDPIANRNSLGTFKVPCVSYAYLIKSPAYGDLSFTKNFTDWEFLAFSKNARNNAIDQYICNEKEFGSFLHFNKEMSDTEERAFTLAGTEFDVSPKLLKQLLSSHYPHDPHLKEYAENFNFQDYAIYRIENHDLFYLDEVNDYIKHYVLKQGLRFEEYIHDQFKKYVKPGTVALDIGGHIGIHALNLSRLVGEKGQVHVFEPQAKMFCELAVNLHLNQCKNIAMHHNALGASEKWIEIYLPKEEWTEQFGKTVVNEGHGTVTEAPEHFTGDKAKMIPLDSLHLDNISFIKMDVEGFEMEVVRGGIETIKRNKPVMIIEIFQNSDLQKKIQEIESLGYVHTALSMDNYLFTPVAETNPKKIVKANNATLNVAWEGSFFDLGSLSNVNRSLIKELAKAPHINLSCITSNFSTTNLAQATGIETVVPLLRPIASSDTSVTVRHAWPPNWTPPPFGKWVLIQPWEFGALPADWVENIAKVDEVWVPSTFVKNEYTYSGVPSDKVKVVPNGYDPAIFHSDVTPYPLATNKKFKFLFIGGTIYRKGSDILLSSYLNAFTKKDDVCLVIKDFGSQSCYLGQTYGDKIKAAQKMPNAAEIIYLDEEMTAEEIASLYKACDCLIYPYRGEGFALPVLEAMACGIPVVVTAGGATSDFVTPDSGWFIPSTPQSIGTQVGTTKLIKEGWLLEPNKDALSSLLTWLPKHPKEAKAKGIAASKQAKNWTWENAAAIATNRLNDLIN